MPEYIVTMLWLLFALVLGAVILFIVIAIGAGLWSLAQYLRDPAGWEKRQREKRVKQMAERLQDNRRALDAVHPLKFPSDKDFS